MPELIAGVDVRYVDFDTRHGDGGDGVADGVAVVRVRPGIDDQSVAVTGIVNETDEFTLAVALSTANADP